MLYEYCCESPKDLSFSFFPFYYRDDGIISHVDLSVKIFVATNFLRMRIAQVNVRSHIVA